MTDFELSTCVALLLGFGYLLVGQRVLLKRLVLTVATAAAAALIALAIVRTTGGDFFDYAVAVPLALSGGMLLQHLFDFCRHCGHARRLSARPARPVVGHLPAQAVPAHRCPGCRARYG